LSQRILQGRLRPDDYRDSGTLMRLARQLETWPGIRRAAAAMCTPRNLDTLARMGLAPPMWTSPPKADDLFLVVDALSVDEAEAALNAAEAQLNAGPGPAPDAPTTLAEGLAQQPDAQLALISVPGPHAAEQARAALDAGLDVMLFSDGVTLDEEVALKETASARGLLVLGPACGTALWDGVRLGIANVVRRGAVAVVATGGTQHLTCRVHDYGAGISHALSTGPRDLHAAVGGRSTLTVLDRLALDDDTRVIVIVGHRPDPAVAEAVLARAVATGRAVVACFPGAETSPQHPQVNFVCTLDEAARCAATLAGAAPPVAPEAPKAPAPEAPPWVAGQHLLRGIFLDTALAFEALTLLAPDETLGSNLPLPGVADTLSLRYATHSVLDLGAEDFTRGRPHPLLDPYLRNTALRVAGDDPRVAVVLFDLVLGTGCAADPAGDLVPVLRAMQASARSRGAPLAYVASVTGTDDDPQHHARQVATLRDEGVVVLPDNAAAVRHAASLLPRPSP